MTTHLVSRIKQRGPLHVALSNVRRIEPHTPGAVLSAPTPTNRPAPFSIGYRSGGGFPWRLNGDVIGCLSEFRGKSNVINRTNRLAGRRLRGAKNSTCSPVEGCWSLLCIVIFFSFAGWSRTSVTRINRYCTVIGYFPVSFILVFKGRHVGV